MKNISIEAEISDLLPKILSFKLKINLLLGMNEIRSKVQLSAKGFVQNVMNQKISVLVAEDDECDRFLIDHFFCKLPQFNSIRFVLNGEELINTLKNEKSQLPDIILSDLNMPKINGIEALATIKKVPALKKIPFVIYSTTVIQNEQSYAMQLGAAGYLKKPDTSQGYLNIAQNLIDIFQSV